MKRLLVTYTATVTINLPDDVEPTADVLKTFTADKVENIKVIDSHEVVDRDYAVFYNPKNKELIQLTHHECTGDGDMTPINGERMEFTNSIIPDIYEVVNEEEQKLAAEGKLSVIDPEYSGDMTTAGGLKLTGNLCQWVGFDGKLPPISSLDALKGVCEMNSIDTEGWILIAQGDKTWANNINVYHELNEKPDE